LEVLEKSEDPSFNEKKALEQLEEKWLSRKATFRGTRLQPQTQSLKKKTSAIAPVFFFS
jgi:hypothetical protein